MKKLILFAAILFAGVSVVNAQSQTSSGSYDATAHAEVTEGITNKEASTNLTVKLNPIHSILVNTTNVLLEYTTVEDYQNGIKTDYITDHLNVYSTGAYSVGVKYEVVSDTHADKSATASLFESIEIEAQDSENTTRGKISLKTSDQDIITSTEGGINMMFKVDYRGKGGNDYLNFIDKGEARTYVADVIYTLTAL